MNLEYISSKTLNFQYLNGKPISLTIGNSSEIKNALIFYIDEKQVGVSVANSVFFKKGLCCSIEVLYKEHVLKISSSIVRFEDGILYLDMPKKVAIIQQRGDLRVGCNIRCNIERFTTGKIKNLSAGGCYIALDSSMDFDTFNKEHIKICFSINNYDYRLDCSVIEVTDKYMRVKFNNLTDIIKEKLFLYCHLTDKDNYNKVKNAR